MTNKNLVDLSFPKKKEREREITKILHEILPPDLVLFHTDERSSVLNHVFPRRKTSDRDAKGHRRSRRRRRLGFLLFRSESIHVPASTIHIRRKREKKKKKKEKGEENIGRGRIGEQARKEDPDVEEGFKERRFRQPLGIRSPCFSKCFFINSHLNDFRLPSLVPPSLSLSLTAHLTPLPLPFPSVEYIPPPQ